ncbi:TPA: hypothetical protein ACGU7E_002263 [Vibrio vulnificus]|nr:hypothetical protein [Vibrio vulnificus]HDY8099864.1 hypothetical protein [Vibrio vulnificus]
MVPRVRKDDEIKEGKKKPIEDQRQRTKTLNTAAHHQLSFPCTRETIYPRTLDAALEQKLTTVKRTQGHQTFADSEAVRPTHGACRSMGPRIREDDEIKEGKKKPIEDQRQRTKTLNTAAHHQLSFPCTQETIYPHTPDAAFGNTLLTTDSKNNDNAVVIPTLHARRTMGPRVREDDEIKDEKEMNRPRAQI